MVERRRRAAAAGCARRLRPAARVLVYSSLFSLMLLSPGAGRADPGRPAQQLTVAQSGVRLRLGQFVLGPNWVTMTVIVENERDGPVQLAALAGRDKPDSAQAVLADERGAACEAAERPEGIAEILPPADGTRAAIASMTDIPAHSDLRVLFTFPHCRLSHRSLLSLSVLFELSTNGRDMERFPAEFLGIVQRTIMR